MELASCCRIQDLTLDLKGVSAGLRKSSCCGLAESKHDLLTCQQDNSQTSAKLATIPRLRSLTLLVSHDVYGAPGRESPFEDIPALLDYLRLQTLQYLTISITWEWSIESTLAFARAIEGNTAGIRGALGSLERAILGMSLERLTVTVPPSQEGRSRLEVLKTSLYRALPKLHMHGKLAVDSQSKEGEPDRTRMLYLS